MIEPLQRSEDFERVLKTSIRARSTHFAAHHLADMPSRPARALIPGRGTELSTDPSDTTPSPVDEFGGAVNRPAVIRVNQGRLWWGAVVPKRHARRSVTRSLLKRQIRAAIARQGALLSPGLWVIRLRAPFDRKAYPSAASETLRQAAHAELAQLLGSATRLRVGR